MPLVAPCRARCRTSPGSLACLGVKLAVGRCVSDAVVALYTACMVTAPDFADRVMHTLAHAFPERRVLGVWLYGSHARGQATPRSDVDLAVLADRRLDPLAVGAASTELERIAGSRVDLVDLRAASGLLRVQATHEGHLLAAPDRFQSDLFATHALSDHAAFGLNRRMCTQAMKERFRVG